MLTRFLLDLPGVVLLASHDRVLLDDVCTDLVDLDPTAFGTDGLGGRRFGGGWSDYVAAREDARRRWEATYAGPAGGARTGSGRRRGSAPRRSPTTAARPTTTSSSTSSRAPRSRARWRAARRTPSAGSTTAERDQVRKPPKPLTFRQPAGRGGRGRPTGAGPRPGGRRAAHASTASTSRRASTCSSPAPTVREVDAARRAGRPPGPDLGLGLGRRPGGRAGAGRGLRGPGAPGRGRVRRRGRRPRGRTRRCASSGWSTRATTTGPSACSRWASAVGSAWPSPWRRAPT